MKQTPEKIHTRGFALIVTLSLMILLTVIAVGLLTLSSISLRSTGQVDAMAKARANARMALMIAIGELQKSAGPDKAVTANSEILANNPQKANLTGVWDSWDFDVKSNSLDYDGPKTRESGGSPGFKGWLVSDSNPVGPKARNYATLALSGDSVELVGEGSLGKDAGTADKVRAGKVVVTRDGKKTGTFAWHVADESVKARINTYRDLSGDQTLSQKRSLMAGHRPDLLAMENSKKAKLDFLPDDNKDYANALVSTGKIVSLNQAELFNHTPTIKTFRNDVTPYSMGLLTNVREGGLKQDLTSVFEMTTSGSSGTTGFPSAFMSGSTSKKLYQTNVYSNKSAVTGVSDPYWSALAGYYNSYKDLLTPDAGPTLYKLPPENVSVAGSLVQPAQFSPSPVIAKVELMFSLVVRDKHGPWKSRPGDYELHLLYIPVVTLHNPYNVSLRFDRMKIGIVDPPVGFTFLVNGAPRNSLTPLGNLFKGASGRKEFWIEIADWASATATSPTGPTTMKPGQTLIYGPYINATEPFNDDNASYLDTSNNKTGTEAAPLKAKRGFTGGTYGYDVDWLAGEILNVNKTDKIAVEFKPVVPPGSSSFKVTASLTSKGLTKSCGGLSFNYGTLAGLDKILPDLLRFPKTDGIVAEAMHLGNFENPAGSLKAQTFALFSAYGRTANGGVDDTGSRTRASSAKPLFPDGRLSGNPFLHNNAARVAIFSDFSPTSKEKPASQSHELNLLKLDGSADNVISYNSTDFRTNYLNNYKQVSGRSIKSGSYLEIPSGPLQAISDFRRSNALASPYLPAFVQPIGNSYASPLIATDTVLQTGAAAYTLMDHSFLANHALYDGCYFSTFAPVGTKTAADGFTEFMKGGKPLRSQLFEAYLPAGKSADDVKGELFSGSKPSASAYKIAAQYQMVKGAFNVNSTRVQAWKAMLSSMNRSKLNVLWAKSGVLGAVASGGVPIPAMTLHNGSATTGSFTTSNIDDQAANQWNGYREFTDADIEKLAIEIVKQVRLRGPFLSMSEFVNRRLGSDSALTRTGALQNAIDDAELNKTAVGTQVAVTAGDVSDANLYGFKTPLAATGNPAAGAPGWLSQADVLKILEPAATVRSDTFVIRTCGEVTDKNGNVVARAYAEAVVQRIPEYLNPSDPPAAKVTNPNTASSTVDPLTPTMAAPENLVFGRRFVMVSFKWLSQSEI